MSQSVEFQRKWGWSPTDGKRPYRYPGRLDPEIIAWLDANSPGWCLEYHTNIELGDRIKNIQFLNVDDAMVFKLTW
jgi:hypothetical protein